MIKAIEEEIFEFLSSEEPRVLVLRGPWGVGKTFAWQKWLKEASKKNQISLRQYSNVSLFGCNSLDALKAQIFEQLTPVSMIGESVSIDTFADNMAAIGKDKMNFISSTASRLSKALKHMPVVKDYTVDLWRLGWLSVNNALICIDDLERIGADLRIKDIYGLVSILKEQKKCKVLLILNDEHIAGENKGDYQEHREKVVDAELHFDSETEDLIKLVFDESHPHFQAISECISSLGTKNIRTIQKIKNYLDKLSPLLEHVQKSYYENAIKSIVLFTVLYFSQPKGWPYLDEVLETDENKFSMINSFFNDDPDKEETLISRLEILKSSYDWNGCDALDRIFGDYVKKGYLDNDRLQDLIKKADEDEKRILLKNEAATLHSKVSDILRDGFEDNINDLIAVMEESIKAGVNAYPSIGHLNRYVRILRDLGQNTAIEKLINIYIGLAEKRDSRFLRLSDVDTAFAGEALDDQVVKLIQAAYEQLRAKEMEENLLGVDRQKKLLDVARRSPEYRLTQGDYELLSRFEEKDFMTFLRTSKKSREISDFMDIFLSDNPVIKDCTEEHQAIQAHLISVVYAVSKENPLNALRAKPYLILINELQNAKNANEANK